MKILFAGTPTNAADSLRALVNGGHNVVGVLTRSDAEVGRKRILTPSAVAQAAEELHLPVIKANRVTSETIGQIAKLSPDLGVVVAYGSLLDKVALESLSKGWVNLHFSLLPDWRGAAPAQRALLSGESVTGVTLFQLDDGLDTGPIWGQVAAEVQPRENSAELLARLTSLGGTLLNEQLPRIESGLFAPTPQVGEGRIAKKLTREEARLDFTLPAPKLELSVRAFNPEPVAHTDLAGEVIRVLDAVALGNTDWSALATSDRNPGSLIFESKRVLVQCGGGTLLELKTVQPAGKKPMTALDWSRGTKATHLG